MTDLAQTKMAKPKKGLRNHPNCTYLVKIVKMHLR